MSSNEQLETTKTTEDPELAPATAEQAARVAQLIGKHNSLARTAVLLRMSPLTVAKIAGGQRISRGSRALLAERLRERDAAGRVP